MKVLLFVLAFLALAFGRHVEFVLRFSGRCEQSQATTGDSYVCKFKAGPEHFKTQISSTGGVSFDWGVDGIGNYAEWRWNATYNPVVQTFQSNGVIDFGSHLYRSTHSLTYSSLSGALQPAGTRLIATGSAPVSSGTGQFAVGGGYLTFVGDFLSDETKPHAGVLLSVYFDSKETVPKLPKA